MSTVITFGTFDLLHIGHINILKRAKAEGSRLVVGVSTDRLNIEKKGVAPIFNEHNRLEIVRSLRFVDECFLEDDLELKREYIKKYQADVLVMGHDWRGRFDFCKDLCEVVYLERTKEISTSFVKAFIIERTQDDLAIREE